MKISEQLQRVGLDETEAALYSASLKIGPASVLRLARETNLNRPLLYRTLERMVAEGLFEITVSGRRKLYAASPPRRLLAYMHAKESLLKDLLPDLEALAVSSRTLRITYFKGRDRVQHLLKTQHEAHRKEVLAYFPVKLMLQVFGKRQLEDVIQERIRRHIKAKILRPRSAGTEYEGWELRQEALRDVRYLPDDRPLDMGIVIFDNKVNLFSPTEEDFGVQIESSVFSALMRYFFEALWSISLTEGADRSPASAPAPSAAAHTAAG